MDYKLTAADLMQIKEKRESYERNWCLCKIGRGLESEHKSLCVNYNSPPFRREAS